MKKKLLSIIATAMSICMGVSFFAGCNQGGDSSSSLPKPKEEDQILAYVLAATANSAVYDGAYTYTLTRDAENKYPTSGHDSFMGPYNHYWTKVDEVTSMDPKTGRGYHHNKSANTYDKDHFPEPDIILYKSFEENGSLFTYDYRFQNSMGEGTEVYKAVNAELLEEDNYLYNRVENLAERYLYNMHFPIASSLEEINAAYAAVIADSKAEIMEETENKNFTLDASIVYSCEKNKGEYVLTRTSTYASTSENNVVNEKTEIQLAAKDDKLVRISVKHENFSTSQDESDTTVEMLTKYNEEHTFAYTFDEKKYNDIETALPADVASQAIVNLPKIDLDVYLNGIHKGLESVYATTVQSALSVVSPINMNVVWYTDEACTQKLNTNISLDELRAMRKIYGQATPLSSTCLIMQERKYQFADDVPEAYKKVYTTIFATTVKENSITSRSPLIDFVWKYNEAVMINGEVVSNEEYNSYKMKAGETYEIKVIAIYSKSDLNIFKYMSVYFYG